MNDDFYDLQDYPEMRVSKAFLKEVRQLIDLRQQDGTVTAAEVAAKLIDLVLTLDPEDRADLQREHDAILAHYERRGRAAEYRRLKAELARASVIHDMNGLRKPKRD